MEIRGSALSACGVLNWLSCFAVVFDTRFLSLRQVCKFFATVCFVGFVGVYLWVIETKGCSMNDSPLTPRSKRNASPLMRSLGAPEPKGEEDSRDDESCCGSAERG